MQAKERSDPQGWLAFQTQVSSLKLQRSRLEREAEDLQGVLDEARRRERQAGEFDAYEDAVGQWDRKDAQDRTSRWVGVLVQLHCGGSGAGAGLCSAGPPPVLPAWSAMQPTLVLSCFPASSQPPMQQRRSTRAAAATLL
jgi:hypothetical protein